MNRKEKQDLELWMIDLIVTECIKDNTKWEDHPLGKDLKDLQTELYPEKEEMNTCWWCGIEIDEGEVCEECREEGFIPMEEWKYEEYREKRIQEERWVK